MPPGVSVVEPPPVTVIVEVPAKDLPLEPSQGTHFFHNLISAGVGYFSMGEPNEQEFVRWDLLKKLPGEEIAGAIRHIRFASPLTVCIDGQTQQGVLSFPPDELAPEIRHDEGG